METLARAQGRRAFDLEIAPSDTVLIFFSFETMSPHTAKAIKELSHLFGNVASAAGFYDWQAKQEEFERLLHELAENIRTDTIEP